jgi:C1A family cysteine protease
MKILTSLIAILFLMSCSSDFSFERIPEEFGTDEDGDPVIINPEDDPERSFGHESGFCYGFSEPDPSYLAAEIDVPSEFPDSLDLSKYLPETRSQGRQGSCVAWATGYYLKSFQENYQEQMMGIPDPGFTMSPAFIFNQIQVGDCNGSRIDSAMVILQEQGIVPWIDLPYSDERCDALPSDEQKVQASAYRIENFYYIDGENLFEKSKAALLQDKPIVIAISIDRAYFGAKEADGTAVYRKFKNGNVSHAMLVVGYNDLKNAFKAVNSWGRNWGNEGFVWIDYKAFQEVLDPDSEFKVLCEAWVADDLIPEPDVDPAQSLISSSR